jgi:DNA-binding MarR family transcriptional regulator
VSHAECGPAAIAGVGGAIVRVSRAHRGLASDLLRRIGLHPGQEMLLLLVGDGEWTPRQLATRLHVEPATITKMLQRLQASGFVERMASATDLRSRPLRLTASGREAAAQAATVWQELEAITTRHLSPAEQVELRRLLAKVTDGIAAEEHTSAIGGCSD